MKSSNFDLPLFEEWLDEKRQLSGITKYVYMSSLKRFLTSNPTIDSIEDYNTFLIKTTIKKHCTHYYSVLKAYIEFKIKDSSLRKRLSEALIRPKEKKDIVRERKHLSEDKLIDIVNYLDNKKHRIIAMIQMLTGVRAGDILPLKRGTIFYEKYNEEVVMRINITGKGRKRNVIFIHDKIAQQVIHEYIENNINFDDYYFLEKGKMKHREGQPDNESAMIKMNYLWYWHDLKQALIAAGVEKEVFATHDFRRCFARRAWERYKDIHILQGLLNHADPKVTLRYLDQSGLKNIDYHMDMQK